MTTYGLFVLISNEIEGGIDLLAWKKERGWPYFKCGNTHTHTKQELKFLEKKENQFNFEGFSSLCHAGECECEREYLCTYVHLSFLNFLLHLIALCLKMGVKPFKKKEKNRKTKKKRTIWIPERKNLIIMKRHTNEYMYKFDSTNWLEWVESKTDFVVFVYVCMRIRSMPHFRINHHILN